MKDTDLLIDVDVEIPHGIQMGYDDNGLPITIPADKEEPKAKKEAKKDDKAEPAPVTLAQLEAANRERDAEREARAKAEAEAKTAREAAETVTGKLGKTENLLHDRTIQGAAAHWRSVHSEHQQITSAIAQTEALATSYEKELATAMEAGDHARVASTQRAIAKAEAHLAQLEAGKSASAQEVERAERLYREVNAAPVEKEEPKAKVEPEAKKPDPAPVQVTPDQWIENVKTTVGDDGTAWLKAHKDYVTDPKLNRKLLRFAEEYAEDHGVAALKSSAFVDALNDKFDPKAKEAAVNKQAAAEEAEAEAEEVEEQEVPVKRSAPAAPVSRASNPGAGGTGGSKSKVILSPLEQKTAVDMYPNLDPVEARKRYANNKARALADGKYK